MPDITKGKTFTTGEEVSASDMNSIIDLAVINSDAITESKIASGAVVNDTVSASANIVLSKLASGLEGQIPVCNALGVPTYAAVSGDATIDNLGAVALTTDSVVTTNITDLNVTTGKLAANAVTAGKLDNLLTDSGGTAAAYTNCSITVDATGRVSAASSGSSAAGFEFETFTVGTSTWNRPAGATLIRVVAVAGGGGGAGGGSTGIGGDGGSLSDWIDVTSVSSVSVVVGAGGVGSAGGAGLNGVNTTFGGYLTAGYGTGGSASGSGAKAANGTVAASQTSAQSTGLPVAGVYGEGGAVSGANGGDGFVIVQVMG